MVYRTWNICRSTSFDYDVWVYIIRIDAIHQAMDETLHLCKLTQPANFVPRLRKQTSNRWLVEREDRNITWFAALHNSIDINNFPQNYNAKPIEFIEKIWIMRSRIIVLKHTLKCKHKQIKILEIRPILPITLVWFFIQYTGHKYQSNITIIHLSQIQLRLSHCLESTGTMKYNRAWRRLQNCAQIKVL